MTDPDTTIAFQGELGAYSHMACLELYPDMTVAACASFEDTFDMVEQGRARLAMIPIENSTAGRVADIHHLLPESSLHIIREHFQPIHHCLMAVATADDSTIRDVLSHVQALGQCRKMLRARGLTPHAFADTAGAAHHIAEQNDPTVAAIASALAATTYDLQILQENIEDLDHNTTRFVVMSREPNDPRALNGPVMTTFTFEVKNIPAALYKALGGFATNSVNMTKLESYQVGGSFTATEFYADIEGCEEENREVERAMEELRFHTKHVRVLGTYPQELKRGV